MSKKIPAGFFACFLAYIKPMFKAFLTILLLLAFLAPNPAKAGESPQFIFPVACTLGEDCWTIHYVDTDPSEGAAKDFKCGPRSNDDLKGTAFAVRSFAEIHEGINVLAAKKGKVARLRDGEADITKTQADLEAVTAQQRECGNAVLLDHGSGLQTLYCHLKKDSLTVKRGDTVNAGQKIGQIGLSGLTEFPHLHFGVVWEGGVVDPYTGMLNTDGCGQMKQSLWAIGQPMHYEPVAFFDIGFLDKVPDYEALINGKAAAETLSTDSPSFVFWIGLYGVVEGDDIKLEVHDPKGNIFLRRHIKQDKTNIRQFYYTGRKLDNRALAPGTYTATATLKREGLENISTEKTITVN